MSSSLGTTGKQTSGDWFNSKWKAFVGYWKGSTSRVNVLIGGVFVFIGFSMVYVQLHTINERQREADIRSTERAIYQSEIGTYSQDVAAYRLCLDSVGRSDDNRGQWEQLVEIIRDLGTPGANEFADAMSAGPLLSSAPRVAQDCSDPGPPPTPPD
jgi:hypothetical protein